MGSKSVEKYNVELIVAKWLEAFVTTNPMVPKVRSRLREWLKGKGHGVLMTMSLRSFGKCPSGNWKSEWGCLRKLQDQCSHY